MKPRISLLSVLIAIATISVAAGLTRYRWLNEPQETHFGPLPRWQIMRYQRHVDGEVARIKRELGSWSLEFSTGVTMRDCVSVDGGPDPDTVTVEAITNDNLAGITMPIESMQHGMSLGGKHVRTTTSGPIFVIDAPEEPAEVAVDRVEFLP